MTTRTSGWDTPTAVALVVASSLACGTAGMAKSVRTQAASDFSCPLDQIELAPADPLLPRNNAAYTAKGCGQEKTYEGACSFSCTVQDAPTGEAREALLAARAQPAPAATPDGSPAAAPASAGATPVYFSIKSECPRTVKLFIGDKPRFSSGTETSLSSNEVRSFSEDAGETLWLLDDSGDGVGALTVAVGMRDSVITSSCSGFAPRD